MLENHDTFPVDQFAAISDYQNYLKSLANIWKDYVDVDMFSVGGYYSKKINDDLVVMVINNLFYDPNNIINQLYGGKDAGQMDWIQATAELYYNKTIWVVGHVPLGSFEDGTFFTNRFINITRMYPNIKETFWGHTHHDAFILWNDTGHGYIAPSVVPDGNMNPSVRVYEYDVDTITDYYQYHLNLYDANMGAGQFELSYSAKELYELNDLSYNSWNELYYRLLTNTTLQQYYYYYYYGANDNLSPCDTECMQYYLTDIYLQ